ncbi:hypothetical protein DFA_06414 [Cavenderia fasciculata]|uniref:Uncharacterized protein n=1 Tax=Cavenderia fasciculata TaxID=261658 RepID=F4PIX8_CACFS|nr:uncharacterized protein DFA_06414 [Cavenderia fasciculata]EGG24264.1 hypothetical protein DFA_06414 [Cavenderia fasciculata]|eukprot:XP_004362115.1 hypothetical protein DFA_06414 [Cavenderia fasciculata]
MWSEDHLKECEEIDEMKGIWNSIKGLAKEINRFHIPQTTSIFFYDRMITEMIGYIDQIESKEGKYYPSYSYDIIKKINLETETTLFSILFSYIDRDKISVVRDMIIQRLIARNSRSTDKLIEQAYEMHFIVRRQQQQLKKYYAQSSNDKDYGKLNMPIVPLINVYKKDGYVSDDITFINHNHARYICPTRELFKMSIDKHLISIKCDGLLDNIKWSDNNGTEVWLAGGCPFSALDRKWIGWLSRYKHFCEVRRLVSKFSLPMMINNTINRLLRPFIDPLSGIDMLPTRSEGSMPDYTRDKRVEVHTVRDYDFFIICKNVSDGQRKVVELTKQIHDYLVKLGHTDITIKRTCNTFTIGPFTIILPLFHSLEELLVGFDLDCCCVAYNGQDVYVHPRALQSYATRTNCVPHLPTTIRSSVPHERIAKYKTRGIKPQYIYIHCKHIFCRSIKRMPSSHPTREEPMPLCYSDSNLCQQMENISISQLEHKLGNGTNVDIGSIESLWNYCVWASLQTVSLLCMTSHHHKHCSECAQPLGKSAQLGRCRYCKTAPATLKKIPLTEPKTIVLCGRNFDQFLNRFEFQGMVVFVTLYPYTLYRQLYQMFEAQQISMTSCAIIAMDDFNNSQFQHLASYLTIDPIPAVPGNKEGDSDGEHQPLFLGQIINLLFEENRFKDYYLDNSGNTKYLESYTQLEIYNMDIEEEIKTNSYSYTEEYISQFITLEEEEEERQPNKKKQKFLPNLDLCTVIKQDFQAYSSFIKLLQSLQFNEDYSFYQYSFIDGLKQSNHPDLSNLFNDDDPNGDGIPQSSHTLCKLKNF